MKPYFISDLQKHLQELPEGRKQELRLLLQVNEKEEYRKLSFAFPCEELLLENRALYRNYLLAMINNMLVSFGGARLLIYRKEGSAPLDRLLAEVIAEFQQENPRNDRTGYGVYLNYINRMNVFLGLGRFHIEVLDLREWPELEAAKEYRIYVPEDEAKEQEILRRTATELAGTCICSLDVGGNSIKGAVVKDGKVLVLKEYQWYPTGCKVAEEMNNPMILMVRFLSVCTGLMERDGQLDGIREVFPCKTSYETLLAAVERAEAEHISSKGRFDAIVVGFPDIVVHNKIAGGESFKHQGLKNNPDTDYEVEFFRTSDLDTMVAPYGKPGAAE